MTIKQNQPTKAGGILPVLLVVLLAFTILVLSLYHEAYHSGREVLYEELSAEAFWLAEAGREWCLADWANGGAVGPGVKQVGSDPNKTFEVRYMPEEMWMMVIGTATSGTLTAQRAIKFKVDFIVPPFEDVIYCANRDEVDWSLKLGGLQELNYKKDGPPPPHSQNQHYFGGNDVAIGNVNVNGSVRLYGESEVQAVSGNNPYDIRGDVKYSQELYMESGKDAHVAGKPRQIGENSFAQGCPDLTAMNYPQTHDYNIAQIFADLNITSGPLPEGHFLRDVVQINVHPNGDPTPGQDDFYFQSTSSRYGKNTPSTGSEALVLGDDKTYYVDGHVWFHKDGPYGFEVDGQAVIVASRDIHISDNLTYKDRSRNESGDMLALIALGQYTGSVRNGYGDIYFGDPEYGTLYTCDAFMFANNNFYYNTKSSGSDTGVQKEPESGFKVFGNFMAVNQVIIRRDWYEDDSRPGMWAAEYIEDPNKPASWIWVDVERFKAGAAVDQYKLSDDEIDSIRHYAMQVEYDARIRDVATTMSGLPTGRGSIFSGLSQWEEIPVP